jgi:hypothetical protein
MAQALSGRRGAIDLVDTRMRIPNRIAWTTVLLAETR